MKDARGWNRCAYCGKFFAVRDVSEGKVKCNYTPDTSFSSEDESFFYHVKCELENNHEVHYMDVLTVIRNLPIQRNKP